MCAALTYTVKIFIFKINAKICHANGEFTVELDEEAQETALILVNHVRIFEGEDPLDCVIEN